MSHQFAAFSWVFVCICVLFVCVCVLAVFLCSFSGPFSVMRLVFVFVRLVVMWVVRVCHLSFVFAVKCISVFFRVVSFCVTIMSVLLVLIQKT